MPAKSKKEAAVNQPKLWLKHALYCVRTYALERENLGYLSTGQLDTVHNLHGWSLSRTHTRSLNIDLVTNV